MQFLAHPSVACVLALTVLVDGTWCLVQERRGVKLQSKNNRGSLAEEDAANRCDVFAGGNECGCRQGICWNFYLAPVGPGDKPWCYTQRIGLEEPRSEWALCRTSKDCDVRMRCGNTREHIGGWNDPI
ncbi:hypothetical protein BV898_16749 [Hypsibius exemplaris]|uniref:Secreted protein n=1 Tax=Hypsibius exemplaris TaxID=2072580 RepID=A0A9X6NGG4_HYPEX|nr:hypothetical protein BV898_16749 [Hypsibius exemplaris]